MTSTRLFIFILFVLFNATFNNILVISWWSVLLVEETRKSGGKTTDLPQTTDKLHYIMLYRVHLAMIGIRTLHCDMH